MVLIAGLAGQLGTARRARAQISPGPLARAHQELDGPLNCMKCHAGKSAAMDKACLSCHSPIAALKSANRGFHASTKEQECAACHPDHAGRSFSLIHWSNGSAEKFDHRSAGWPLQGRHAETACRDCHKPAFQTASFMKEIPAAHRPESWLGLERDCAGCHQDLHGGTLGPDCARCHGATGWKPAAAFDHARSAFPLLGKHQKVDCADCHKATRPVALADGGSKPMRLFKPQAHAECNDCHNDPHQGQLGPKCSTCHNADDFHRVSAEQFDHSRTRYPLTGRHAGVLCAQCHDAVKAWGAKPAFDRCAVCHRDPHAGEATLAGKKVDCAACHNVKDFRPSTFTAEQHQASRYPLQGKHLAVACAGCHPRAGAPRAPESSVVKLRPRSAACRDCHLEAHAQQLAARPDRGACETCHTPHGWKPTLFGLPEHAALKLPLDGRHAAIACANCHGASRHDLPPLPRPEELGSAKVAVALPGAACADCHVDVHRPAGSVVAGAAPRGARAIDGDCRNCHTTASFLPSTVGVAAHRNYAFALEGAHQAVPCQACHPAMKRKSSQAALLLARPAPERLGFERDWKRCRDCHEGPHGAQFDGRRGGSDCGVCHGLDAFAPASRFDHDRDAAFALKGAHLTVPCQKCHPAQPGPGNKPWVLYRPVDARCESCHAPGSVKP